VTGDVGAALAPLPAGRPRRLIYLGTPQMAVAPLHALLDAGFDVALVVTRADTRRGRGGAFSPSPVKAAALGLGIPVSHDVDDVLAVGADLGVVVAYGRIIKPHVLAALAMVNLHFSLLPRWRGAAPVERALLAGDATTGVCLMQVEHGLDTGGLFGCVEVAIAEHTTAASLRDELVATGCRLLVDQLADGLATPRPQVGEPTYAAKIDPGELQIDWTRPAVEIDRLVRLGGAWTTFRGRRLKVHEARIGADGSIEATVVQPDGRAAMTWRDFANGARLLPGERLGT
jgi:methionyl-tRNA formyltransferase